MSLRQSDVGPAIIALQKKQDRASKNIVSAFEAFMANAAIIKGIATAGSADETYLSSVIAWADDPSNPDAGSTAWLFYKEQAEQLLSDAKDKSDKNDAAAPQVLALMQ